MARRTKAEKIEGEVEEALAQALDFNFDSATTKDSVVQSTSGLIDLDDLALQIAQATEELAAETAPGLKNKDEATPAVDDSVAESLFGTKPARESTGGTVHDTMVVNKPRPANDDLDLVTARGKISNKPSRIYWSTTALSALWATGGAYVASTLAPAGLAAFAATPVGMAVAAGTAVPILMFWGFAQLSKRSSELKNIAATVSDAALRLSRQQTPNEDQMALLGKTISQEVSAMNEGIKRTLSSAVELEALLQGEVQNLERAYSENETRIHSLISELANERNAILGHADRVQSTIHGTQDQLSKEFGEITSNIASNVENVTKTLTETLQQQGNDLVAKLTQVGQGVSGNLADKFRKTAEELQKQNSQLYHNLEQSVAVASERFEKNSKIIFSTFNEGAAEAERHAEELGQRMQAATNRALSDFDEKISNLNDRAQNLNSSFGNATEAAISAFEKRLSEVDSSLAERGNSIINSFITRAQTLEENTEKLGGILDARANQINETLKERTIEIANTFTSGRNNFLSIIDDGKKLLTDEVNSLDFSLGEMLKNRSQEFKAELAEGREQIAEMLGGETDKLSETVKNQIDILSDHISGIEQLLQKNLETLDQHSQDHVESIEKRTTALQAAIEKSFETANELLDTQSKNIDIRADALRDSLTINSSALNEVLADQARALDERIENIKQIIAKGDLEFSETVGNQVLLVKDAITSNNETLKSTFAGHLETLKNHTELLEKALTVSNDSLLASVDERMGTMHQNLVTSSNTINERAKQLEYNLTHTLGEVNQTLQVQSTLLGQQANELKNIVAANNEGITRSFSEQTAILEERAETMRNALNIGVTNVKAALENSALSLSASLRDNISVASEIFTDKAQQAAELISQTGGNLVGSLSSETDKAYSLLNDTSTKLVNNIAQASQAASNMISTAGNGIATSLAEQTEKAQSVLSNSNETLTVSLSNVADRASALIAQSGNQVVTSFNNEAGKLQSRFADISDGILSTLNSETDKVHANIANVGKQFVVSFADVAVKAESVLSASGKRAVASLTEQSDNIGKTLAAAGDGILSSLDNKINDAANRFNEAGQTLASTFDNEISRAEGVINQQAERFNTVVKTSAASIEQSLADRSSILNETVQQLQNKLDHQLNAAGEKVASIVSGASSQISDNVEQLTNMAEGLGKAAQQTSSSLGTLATKFGEQLNSATQEASQRIYAQNDALMNAFAQRSKQTLQAVSSVKDDFVTNISGLLTKVEQSTQNISQTANALMSSIDKIDNQVNETAKSFYQNSNQIAGNLANSNQMMSHNFDMLQGLSSKTLSQIGQMSQGLDKHAQILSQAIQMVEQSQNSFSSTVEDKQAALVRLSDTLVSKSEEISQIISHYESVIGSALKQTDQTTRDAAAKMQQSLNDTVVAASSKFANATDEMRRASEAIKNDLEKTSNDLNTSIRLLPSQTRDSADAMRSAVSDQIKALQELSLLMQKNVQDNSFSRPATTSSAKSEPVFYDEQSEHEIIFKPKLSAKSAASNPVNTPSSKDGWISNLLARASRGDKANVATLSKVEQNRPTDQVIDSLNSLSVDIVRAIDHNAAVELWDHYRRGQRNIYTQRLYTLSGQKTFEKIRQKYLMDSEFRRSVNQYIADFEKLLRDISRETGDRETIRDYLTSDTGKVYTMLAHASDRIQ
ncbi:hypothetical protein [uncultured Bartonella sp.]|uniref:apolipoprotein A-IV repeat region-like domain-containing protein n=1 Tax=uncultured Bartonella sp. TaxID=104108 RepID=UPI002604456F|nr:hypothetical protein [uncultured Bartonella sp.]